MFDLPFVLFSFYFFQNYSAARAQGRGGLPVGGLGVTVLCEGDYVCKTAVRTGKGRTARGV